MKILFPLLLIILLILTLLCCATASVESIEEGIDQEKVREELLKKKREELFAEAVELLEICSPASLINSAEVLKSSELQSSLKAGELSALAGALYSFLYPEAEQKLIEGLSAYSGPYMSFLESARSGKEEPFTKTGGIPFFDCLIPRFYMLYNPVLPDASLLKELEEIVPVLKKAEEINKTSVLPPYFLGWIAEINGDFTQARSLYKASFKENDSFYPGIWKLARLELERGQPTDALQHLKRVEKLITENISLFLDLAKTYLLCGQPDQASALTAQGLIRNPEDPDFLLLRARILLNQGNWPQALKPLHLVILKLPETKEAYLLKARILHEKKRNSEEALTLLRDSQKIFPQSPEFPEAIGKILMEMGNRGQGLNELNRALEIDPDRISVLRMLLKDTIDLKRWIQAGIFLSRIIEQDELEEDLVHAYQIYSNLGDTAEALYYAEKLNNRAKSEVALCIYAEALLANKEENTKGFIENGLKQVESSEAKSELLRLSAELEKNRDREASLQSVREALILNPDNLKALILISDLYISLEEYRKATIYLKRASEIDADNGALKARLRQVENVIEH